jgi:hypothetical protein
VVIAVLLACGSPEGWVAPEAPSPLRRLTASQLENALQDLFPGVPLPPLALPDELRVGAFDNQAATQAPSPLWVEDLHRAAVAVTEAAVAHPEGWSPCPAGGGPDPAGCGEALVAGFLARALRRPVSPEESAPFVALFAEALAETGDFDVATQLALQAVLQDPEFLWLVEDAPGPPGARIWLDGPEVATRLALLLWASVPDAPLLEAAAAGRLGHADGVEAEARRMLADPRAARGFLAFHRGWMDLDAVDDVIVSYLTYPEWDVDQNGELRDELEAFVSSTWADDEARLSALLLDRRVSATPYVAGIYGLPAGATELGPERAGLLTRAGWLAGTGHLVHPSPVLRGVFVLDRLLCAPPPDPPPGASDDLTVLATSRDAGTNRERFAAHVADPGCAVCHEDIDGIGFGFEAFDSLGRYREVDGGAPVDASGALPLAAGPVPFDGAVELSELLAASPEVRRCHARHWWTWALGRAPEPEDAPILGALEDRLAADDDVREWLVALVRSETFRSRRAD